MFRLGYNTNGLAHHRIGDALALLADLGYHGVAITPDVGQLDPFRLRDEEVRAVRDQARALDLSLAVETGARYLLDPRRKHQPTLLDPDAAQRERRIDFLCRSIELAVDLGAKVVSTWSGTPPAEEDREALWDRLCRATADVLAHARRRGVRLAFEPEPGMFVERPGEFLELHRRLGEDGRDLGLCLDVGHLLATRDLPIRRVITELAPHLVHVHLDDGFEGRHEHLMFGQGQLDLRETLSSLVEVGYEGLAAVELSRDGHRGVEAAQEAIGHLRRALLGGFL